MTRDQAIAQLRHAYKQAYDGTIDDQRAFAEGLLGPAIEALEKENAKETYARRGK